MDVTLNTVENPVAPEATVSVTVVKEWHDQNNANHHRPANLRVTLSNGQSYILNEANGWTVTVDDLPAELDGEPIVYTWTEQAVPGYVHTETRVEGDTTILVNEPMSKNQVYTAPEDFEFVLNFIKSHCPLVK